jgi:hypothetical protein
MRDERGRRYVIHGGEFGEVVTELVSLGHRTLHSGDANGPLPSDPPRYFVTTG